MMCLIAIVVEPRAIVCVSVGDRGDARDLVMCRVCRRVLARPLMFIGGNGSSHDICLPWLIMSTDCSLLLSKIQGQSSKSSLQI